MWNMSPNLKTLVPRPFTPERRTVGRLDACEIYSLHEALAVLGTASQNVCSFPAPDVSSPQLFKTALQGKLQRVHERGSVGL